MNLPSKEIKNQSRLLARNLLAQAEKNEPKITDDLKKIASGVLAQMVGLEDKLKTLQSLTRKLYKESKASTKVFVDSGYPVNESVEKFTKRQAARNNDALRYTFIFPLEKYVFGFKQTVEKLKQNGYAIPNNKIWNAWKNIGTIFDKGYRGINITVVSSEKQKFELQFHTRESYGLKTETHSLYELLRSGKISPELKIEISEKIIRLAREIKTPKGVNKL